MVTKAPVEGAILTTRVAPASEEDPVAWVAERLRAVDWEPCEGHGEVNPEMSSKTWVMVELWAIPPNYDEIVARRESRKRKVAVP